VSIRFTKNEDDSEDDSVIHVGGLGSHRFKEYWGDLRGKWDCQRREGGNYADYDEKQADQEMFNDVVQREWHNVGGPQYWGREEEGVTRYGLEGEHTKGRVFK
jgi:hypothetical protein